MSNSRGIFQGNVAGSSSRILEMLTSSKAVTASYAISAEKLSTDSVGGLGEPVYFRDGKPVADVKTGEVVDWVVNNSGSLLLSGSISTGDASYIVSGSYRLRIDPVAGEFVFETMDKSIQELIDEGYAYTTVTGSVTYITLRTDCPYSQEEIRDFNDILSNKVQIDGAIANTLRWSEALPTGWSAVEVAKAYTDSEAFSDIQPKPNLFWGIDMGDVDEISLKFAGASWYIVNEGLFNPRGYGSSRTATPKTVNVTIDGDYSSDILYQNVWNTCT